MGYAKLINCSNPLTYIIIALCRRRKNRAIIGYGARKSLHNYIATVYVNLAGSTFATATIRMLSSF